VEPFDRAFPDVLHEERATYSHLITDHFHYWEDGGATYHNRYDSYELVRGQEGDPWKAKVAPDWDSLRARFHPAQFSTARRDYQSQNVLNREVIREEGEFPSVRVFDAGIDFLLENRDADDWLLQIETFDPHEPFHAPTSYKAPYATGWNGPIRDWPRYGRVEELPDEAAELRANYYATVALCDAQLGRVLDVFDENDLWQDTALVVTTDHGFLLGEHDFWAKNRMTLYEELARIPLFVHDPRRPGAGQRIAGLTQTPDLCATMLDLHAAPLAPEMRSHSVLPLIDGAPSAREAVLFGYFGGAVNVADGRWTYHRYPPDLRTQEIYQYTLMPTHIFDFFPPEELRRADLAAPMPFTKGMPTLKVPVAETSAMYKTYGPGQMLEDETRLYDLATDPGQQHPLDDPAAEARMAGLMAELMAALDAPPEAFARLSLPPVRQAAE
jgi:arylsulfatase A-like enzyme